MKKWGVLLALCFSLSTGSATTHTVVSSGYTFSPADVSFKLGDTLSFSLASIHDVVEVSQATWDANGSTSNGGFETPYGGGTVVLTHTGTYYYVCATHVGSFGMKGTITVISAAGVKELPAEVPSEYALRQNYPNPFNPTTIIGFALPAESRVSLRVYNLVGQAVDVLADGTLGAGERSVEWNASSFPTGIYFARLEAISTGDPHRTFSSVMKMALVR